MRSGSLLLLALVAGLSSAAEPANKPAEKPPYQRLLQGDDARQADALQKRVAEREAADDDAAALQASEELLALRSRVQGMDHYEVVSLQWEIDALRKVAALPAKRRADWRKAVQGEQEAIQLEQRGSAAQALPLRQRLLDLRRETLGDEHPETALSYNNVALNLHAQGKYAEAETLLRKALEVRRKVLGTQHPYTAASYNNLAYALNAQGRYAEAELLYRQTLDITTKVLGEEHFDTASGYNNVAYTLQAEGKYTDAEPLFRKALALRKKLLGETHADTAQSYNNVAYNLHTQGKYADAETLFRQALDGFKKALGEEHPHTATGCSNLAGNLDTQGKYAEAEPLHRKALAIFQKTLGEKHPRTALTCSNLAINLNDQGKYTEAELLLRQALDLHLKALGEEHPDTAQSYTNLAYNLSAQRHYAEAETYTRKALQLCKKLLGVEHPLSALTYTNLASDLHAQGKYAEALGVVEEAVHSYEAARLAVAASGLERAAFGTKQSPLPLLVAALARAGQPVAAWQRLEQHLGRGLLDDLAGNLDTLLTREERSRRDGLRLTLQQLQSRILALTARSKLTDGEQRQLNDLLAERQHTGSAMSELAAAVSQRAIVSLERAQAQLPRDAALLAWIDVTDQGGGVQEHWGCVLRSGRPVAWVRLPGSGMEQAWTREDATLPDALRQALANAAAPSSADVVVLSRRLAAQRLAPLEQHLDGVRHLVVCPAGSMAALPLEALTDQYTISYVPSATVFTRLAEKRLQRSVAPTLLALGDPVFDRGHRDAYPPLPGTRREIHAIAPLFASATVLLGSDASQQRLAVLAAKHELTQYRYLHFATHGEVESQRLLQSALILSQDRLPDPTQEVLAGRKPLEGRLTAQEILDTWKLDAGLVTLSACQTGLGRQGGGEGFIGFSQALLLVGARSVVLSLWQVDDQATALLMQRFYQNLLGKRADLKAPLSRAEALREAKAWLRELTRDQVADQVARLPKLERGGERARQPAAATQTRPFAHPYYWSAFILIGDPN
jgi:CHAT domain-containing protein/Flp pilus assembly protein TadD